MTEARLRGKKAHLVLAGVWMTGANMESVEINHDEKWHLLNRLKKKM